MDCGWGAGVWAVVLPRFDGHPERGGMGLF